MHKSIIILFLFPLLLVGAERTKQIDIVHNWTSNPNDQAFADISCLAAIKKTLQEKNIKILMTDLLNEEDSNDLSYVVVWNKPGYFKKETLNKFAQKKLLLFAWEPRVVQKDLYSTKFLENFKRVYTWDDDLVDNKKFFKFYYPVLLPMIQDRPSFEEKKLLTQISGNKRSKHSKELYSARESVIQFFEDKPCVFEFYGTEWGKRGYKNYKGAPANKLEVLKNYRFSVCYENMRDVKGYVTEKIFDCFAAGVVPIYWGASNITDFIPKNCFIDQRDFKDINEVYEHIRTMDKATYDTYIKNIQAYLESDQAKLFSLEMFNVIFLEAIRFP
jgi:alpha(1,3/1,4) fucosyltransferase